jgi:hypothetical protein
MAVRVSVVPWGNIENPGEPIKWGLKVGRSYVCRGKEPLFFPTRKEAEAERDNLRRSLSAPPSDKEGGE